MNINDSAEEEAKLVMDIYEYAFSHGMDIKVKQDVMDIMNALNQENTTDERIERLMKTLQITADRIQSDIAGRKKVN